MRAVRGSVFHGERRRGPSPRARARPIMCCASRKGTPRARDNRRSPSRRGVLAERATIRRRETGGGSAPPRASRRRRQSKRVEDGRLVFLQIASVAEAEALLERERAHRRCRARSAAHELGHVRIFLLRHHGRARRKPVQSTTNPNSEDDQSTSSSPMRDRCTASTARAAAISIRKSRLPVASIELRVGARSRALPPRPPRSSGKSLPRWRRAERHSFTRRRRRQAARGRARGFLARQAMVREAARLSALQVRVRRQSVETSSRLARGARGQALERGKGFFRPRRAQSGDWSRPDCCASGRCGVSRPRADHLDEPSPTFMCTSSSSSSSRPRCRSPTSPRTCSSPFEHLFDAPRRREQPRAAERARVHHESADVVFGERAVHVDARREAQHRVFQRAAESAAPGAICFHLKPPLKSAPSPRRRVRDGARSGGNPSRRALPAHAACCCR